MSIRTFIVATLLASSTVVSAVPVFNFKFGNPYEHKVVPLGTGTGYPHTFRPTGTGYPHSFPPTGIPTGTGFKPIPTGTAVSHSHSKPCLPTPTYSYSESSLPATSAPELVVATSTPELVVATSTSESSVPAPTPEPIEPAPTVPSSPSQGRKPFPIGSAHPVAPFSNGTAPYIPPNEHHHHHSSGTAIPTGFPFPTGAYPVPTGSLPSGFPHHHHKGKPTGPAPAFPTS